MGDDRKFLSGWSGMIRLGTLVIGLLTAVLIGVKFSNGWVDSLQLSISIICLLLSVFWILLALFEVMEVAEGTWKIDTFYHLIAAALLLISSIIRAVRLVEARNECGRSSSSTTPSVPCSSKEDYALRLFGSVSGMGTGVLYLIVALANEC